MDHISTGQAYQFLTRYRQRIALKIMRFQGPLFCVDKKDPSGKFCTTMNLTLKQLAYICQIYNICSGRMGLLNLILLLKDR